jgi:hypothetical protein
MMESTVEINGLWFYSILSEMTLNYKTGLKNRFGSPFTQFRRVFKDCPANKERALKYAYELCINNKIERVPNSFTKLLESL